MRVPLQGPGTQGKTPQAAAVDARELERLASYIPELREHGDADHDPDCRPLKWPPPAGVLAFWETGFGGDEGSGAYCTVVALVRTPSEQAATTLIEGAWSPGVGKWRFNREYGRDVPPGDRFPAPSWSIKLGRWPWSKTQQ